MKTKLLLVAAVLTLITSCNQESEAPSSQEKQSAGITFNSSINASKTKMSGSSWEAGDEIAVFMLKSGHGTAYEAMLTNDKTPVKYITLAGDGIFTPFNSEAALFYPNDTTSVDFVAVYPYPSYVHFLDDSFDVPVGIPLDSAGIPYQRQYSIYISVVDQQAQEKLDILYSKNITNRRAKDGQSLNLEFKRIMSKIEFNITAGGLLTDADLVGLKVYSVGFIPINNFDFNFGQFGGGPLPHASYGDYHDVPIKVSADGKFAEATEFADVHYYMNDDGFLFKLSNGEEFKWNFADYDFSKNLKLEQGKKYIYNITINKTGNSKIAVDPSLSTIKDWDDQPSQNIILQ